MDETRKGSIMSLEIFVRESNKIEGILRDPLKEEIDAHHQFLYAGGPPDVERLERFVSRVQPGTILRRTAGLNVHVGNHIAPPGGPNIEIALNSILIDVPNSHPFCTHTRYETLHPFTDGNGRSGRVLWLWMMRECGEADRASALGFLHLWYYQSLSHS